MKPRIAENWVTLRNGVPNEGPGRSVADGIEEATEAAAATAVLVYDLKLRAVKLYLEEGYSAELIAEELGIGNPGLSAATHDGPVRAANGLLTACFAVPGACRPGVPGGKRTGSPA